MMPASLKFPTKPSPSPLPYLTSRLSPALSASSGPSTPLRSATPSLDSEPFSHYSARYRGLAAHAATSGDGPRSSYDSFDLNTSPDARIHADIDAERDARADTGPNPNPNPNLDPAQAPHKVRPPKSSTPPTAISTPTVPPPSASLATTYVSPNSVPAVPSTDPTPLSISSPAVATPTPTPRTISLPSLHAAAVTNCGLQRTFSRHSNSTNTSLSTPASASASVSTSASASALPIGSIPVFTSHTTAGSASSPVLPSATSTRRKSLLLNLPISDPTMPGPGELATSPTTSRRQSMGFYSPSHASLGSPVQPVPNLSRSRTTSLGEIHQELEVEQEAQVNRLLAMIRQQQLELQRLQSLQPQNNTIDESAVASPLPDTASPISISRSASINYNLPSSTSHQQQPTQGQIPRSSFDLVRADIQHRRRNSSFEGSHRLRPLSIGGDGESSFGFGSGNTAMSMAARDDSSFYQAETQVMMRENQMLRHRIRELEKQVADMTMSPSATQTLTRRSSLVHGFTAET
ncbi:hypothetical protein BROUX41_000953 [Berkeleyomyces rouxiae]